MQALDDLIRRCEAAGLGVDNSDVADFERYATDDQSEDRMLFSLEVEFPRGRKARYVEIELLPGLPLVKWFSREPQGTTTPSSFWSGSATPCSSR